MGGAKKTKQTKKPKKQINGKYIVLVIINGNELGSPSSNPG